MEDIFVGRLMTPDVITVDPETQMAEAATTLYDQRIGSLIVVDEDNQPAGIITSTDFVRFVSQGGADGDATVADHMSREVVTVGAQDDIRTAADRFITYNIHHLPVVDEVEGVIGLLSTTDLTAYLSGVETPTP